MLEHKPTAKQDLEPPKSHQRNHNQASVEWPELQTQQLVQRMYKERHLVEQSAE